MMNVPGGASRQNLIRSSRRKNAWIPVRDRWVSLGQELSRACTPWRTVSMDNGLVEKPIYSNILAK
jgi:hypothetical protein